LNTSKRHEVSEVVDIELSRDEDSVTSLAVAQSDDESMVALAGINSSQAEQKKGNNEHLRSFQLEYPPRKSQGSEGSDEAQREEEKVRSARKTTPLSRVSLFKTNVHKPKPGERVDTYQRLLRLSPWRGPVAPRIGAIATGLASSGEIVLFQATPRPQASDIIARIRLGDGEEAEDVDIIDIDEGKFLVAYTTGVDVYTFGVSAARRSETAPEVTPVFTTPFPKSSARVKTRPKFRALRFLSPKTLLLLQNAPERAGCELVILSLPSEVGGFGKVVRRKKIRKAVKIGLGLDVCNLGEGVDKEKQYIIAVAGSDQSIEVFTLDYNPKAKGYGALQVYTTLDDVHPFSLTKVCFSHFQPPPHPITPDVPPQYVKLASISLGNTVVVHTFPASPFPPGSLRTPRYVLKAPGHSDLRETVFSGFVALLIIGISCFLLQAFTEIRGGTPAYLGAADWLPDRVRGMIARPYMFENGRPLSRSDILPSSSAKVPQAQTFTTKEEKSLRDLLNARRRRAAAASKSVPGVDTPHHQHHQPPIIVKEDDSGSISAEEGESHDDTASLSEKHNARTWDELHPEERTRWKRILSDAGHWAVEEGEQILQGILFGQIAAVAGAAVGG
jgi:glycyl-tRNA synthetase